MKTIKGIAISLITALLLMQSVPGYTDWQRFNGSVSGVNNNPCDISGLTTDNVTEGFNKYYTDNRTRAAVSASVPLSYNSSTGVFSLGTVPVTSGGTGSGTTPTKGQMLIGNDNGTFKLNTLTAGSNVTIANDNGSVTIAASAPTWGNISGTLSSQTDLQNELNAKEASIATGTSGQWRNGTKNWFGLYTDNVTEGTNLYHTNARVISAIGTSTAANWYNGTNNYFTLYVDNVTGAVKRTTTSLGDTMYDNGTALVSVMLPKSQDIFSPQKR
ncbi:MAG: hypothetical protein HQK96_13785 [Nitrospirae bacterium]|nr:hypothetical protein [Nitrospirota bacterium]